MDEPRAGVPPPTLGLAEEAKSCSLSERAGVAGAVEGVAAPEEERYDDECERCEGAVLSSEGSGAASVDAVEEDVGAGVESDMDAGKLG